MNIKDLQVVQVAIQQIGIDLKVFEKKIDEIKKTQERDIKDQWEIISCLRQKIELLEENINLKGDCKCK